jgi:hypothetical protein
MRQSPRLSGNSANSRRTIAMAAALSSIPRLRELAQLRRGIDPAGLDLAPAGDEMAVRALTRFRAAIGSRPGNCFGNCRLNEGPQRLRGGLLPCTFTHTGTKAAPDIST